MSVWVCGIVGSILTALCLDLAQQFAPRQRQSCRTADQMETESACMRARVPGIEWPGCGSPNDADEGRTYCSPHKWQEHDQVRSLGRRDHAARLSHGLNRP